MLCCENGENDKFQTHTHTHKSREHLHTHTCKHSYARLTKQYCKKKEIYSKPKNEGKKTKDKLNYRTSQEQKLV